MQLEEKKNQFLIKSELEHPVVCVCGKQDITDMNQNTLTE